MCYVGHACSDLKTHAKKCLLRGLDVLAVPDAAPLHMMTSLQQCFKTFSTSWQTALACMHRLCAQPVAVLSLIRRMLYQNHQPNSMTWATNPEAVIERCNGLLEGTAFSNQVLAEAAILLGSRPAGKHLHTFSIASPRHHNAQVTNKLSFSMCCSCCLCSLAGITSW